MQLKQRLGQSFSAVKTRLRYWLGRKRRAVLLWLYCFARHHLGPEIPEAWDSVWENWKWFRLQQLNAINPGLVMKLIGSVARHPEPNREYRDLPTRDPR